MSSAGVRLKAAREAAGYRSAAKAAEALGMNSSTYNGHENGQNSYTADQARAYGRAFSVSPVYLLFGEESRASPTVVALLRLLTRKGLITEADARSVLEEAAMLAELL